LKQGGEHYLETLKHIRAMRGGGHDSEARGWLRELLISMSINGRNPGGPYGVCYRGAVTDVRESLFGLIPEDNPLAPSIAERWRRCNRTYGTETIDLTDEETMLARLLTPDLLGEVEESWEQDKKYELAIRKMETFACPGDVPPSREGGGYRAALTEEQLCTPFAELRHSGALYEALEKEEV
jgi:hypothetical protein